MRTRDAAIFIAAVIWLPALSTSREVAAPSGAENHVSSFAAKAAIPEFICTVRAYGGAGYDQFQRSSMKELGLDYVQGLVDFYWDHIDQGNGVWKWMAADEQMDQLAKSGLQAIPHLLCLKSPGLPWDETITRADPRFVAQYGEFAYQVVRQYHRHPAWSGLIAVTGGSSDVFGEHPFHAPEVQVPLLNAAYEGIRRADPRTIVISFNLSTSISTPQQWEDWFGRALALRPKFDWFGLHTYHAPVTCLDRPDAYEGVLGLTNVRKFLDRHGYADTPLWLNEGGFNCGEDLGGLPEQTHAEQVVETYVVSRTLGVNLRGWVYFEYFSKTHLFEESSADLGLMTALDQHKPPQPRLAWRALQTLVKTVKFLDYDFDTKVSGAYNEPVPPFVYHFRGRSKPSEILWVAFSGPGMNKRKPVTQDIAIRIAPASRATAIDMLGTQRTLQPDSSGNVTIAVGSSPIYLKAGE
jgi:hypothetical protein